MKYKITKCQKEREKKFHLLLDWTDPGNLKLLYVYAENPFLSDSLYLTLRWFHRREQES